MALIFKDGVPENVHPLNVVTDGDGSAVDSGRHGSGDAAVVTAESVGRPPLFEVYMRMAEELAKR